MKRSRASSPMFRGFSLALCLLMAVVHAHALTSLNDESMSGVTGEGLSFPFESIRVQMASTSFIELTGASVTTCTAPNTPAGCTYLKRGDVRYYGLAMSRGSTRTGVETYTIDNAGGVDWFGNGCTGGTFGLGCPMTNRGIVNYSNFDNPYVLRVFNYNAIGTAGTATNNTVLEFLGPSNTDLFRWAFWGEIQSDRGGATSAILQSQSIILGRPTAWKKPPSTVGTAPANNAQEGNVLRLFQYQGDSSLGLIYLSRLSGDFRFSVNPVAANVANVAPDFTDQEGLYFHKVNAFLPLGQLNYQAITLNDTQTGSGGVSTNGNFVIDLASIGNVAGIYNDFYSLPTALAAATGCNAACQTTARGYNRVTSAIPAHYYDTHGYVEWGTGFPDCAFSNCMDGTGVSTVRFAGTGGLTGASARDDIIKGATGATDIGGIAFLSSSSASTWTVLDNQNNGASTVRTMNAINLGSARIEGFLINHMRITSLGAN